MLVGCWSCGVQYDNVTHAWACPHETVFPVEFYEGPVGDPRPPAEPEDDEDTSGYVGTIDYPTSDEPE